MPAYVIFHDATLRAIAAQAPGTLAELATISGVGEASWPSTASRSSTPWRESASG